MRCTSSLWGRRGDDDCRIHVGFQHKHKYTPDHVRENSSIFYHSNSLFVVVKHKRVSFGETKLYYYNIPRTSLLLFQAAAAWQKEIIRKKCVCLCEEGEGRMCVWWGGQTCACIALVLITWEEREKKTESGRSQVMQWSLLMCNKVCYACVSICTKRSLFVSQQT